MSALIPQTVPLVLSGERFRIVYRLGGTEEEARAVFAGPVIEQSPECWPEGACQVVDGAHRFLIALSGGFDDIPVAIKATETEVRRFIKDHPPWTWGEDPLLRAAIRVSERGSGGCGITQYTITRFDANGFPDAFTVVDAESAFAADQPLFES